MVHHTEHLVPGVHCSLLGKLLWPWIWRMGRGRGEGTGWTIPLDHLKLDHLLNNVRVKGSDIFLSS